MKQIQMQDIKNRKSGLNVDDSIEKKVIVIVKEVKKKGDKALLEYTKKFDNVKLKAEDLLVQNEEIKKAEESITEEVKQALDIAKENIIQYQSTFIQKSHENLFNQGVILKNIVKPFDKVGVYIPGGTAPLVSTVLMTVLPAKVAGVEEVIATVPPQKDGSINPNILYACKLCGVDKIYKVGGAQAIAALAYGTETIPKVNKIVGPGNIYVSLAKKCVFGNVDIDMIAGPSELLVVADESVNPEWTARDLMSQAEHDIMSEVILVCFSKQYADKVIEIFESKMQDMQRAEIIKKSWKEKAKYFIAKNIEEVIEAVNLIAPEHLELMAQDSEKIADKIKNAGAIFLGNYTPEAIGDYVAGPSHVLPTGGSASCFSVLKADDFYKHISLISYDKEAFEKQSKHAGVLAELEGLTAHLASLEVRR
jgi:histidinol dehydrogenase